MQKFLASLMIFVLSGIGLSQSITMEDKVTTPSGKLATIVIKNDGEDVTWTIVPPINGEVIREYDADVSLIKLRLLGYSNGTYYVVVSSTKNKKVTQKTCTVIVGDGPAPVVDLLKTLKVAYAADTDPDKENQLEALTELYEQGSTFTKTRADLKTYGQLWTAFGQVANTLGCHGKLVGLQKLIAAEMKEFTPSDSSTVIDKEKTSTQLQRIAAILKQVK